MAFKLRMKGVTTGVSDNKRGLSIGLKLAFEDDERLIDCCAPSAFLCHGEVWVTLSKDSEPTDDSPPDRLTSKRMAASTGALSIRPSDVRLRLAIDDGTEPSDLCPFKFSTVTVVLEPRGGV